MHEMEGTGDNNSVSIKTNWHVGVVYCYVYQYFETRKHARNLVLLIYLTFSNSLTLGVGLTKSIKCKAWIKLCYI